MCDKIEDLTDFIEFNQNNDLIDDLFDFESEKIRSNQMELDNFLDFED